MKTAVPAGGPATNNGIYYQMLWTLLDVVSVKVTHADDNSLRWVVEPVDGGDLQRQSSRERVVYQAKSRSTKQKWSLSEIVEVFPDFLRAEFASSYVFVTDGSVGDISPIEQKLKDWLTNKTEDNCDLWEKGYNSLCSLEPRVKAKPKAKGKAKAKGEPNTQSEPSPTKTAADFFDRLLTVIAEKLKGPSYRVLSRDELEERLADLIHNFKTECCSITELETRIFNYFDARGIVRENRRGQLDSYIGKLVNLARSGKAIIRRSDILEDCLIPFDHWSDICTRSRKNAQNDLRLLGYDSKLDVRSIDSVTETLLGAGAAQSKTVCLLGKSGQGKTWALAKALHQLSHSPSDSLVILIDRASDLDSDLDRASKRFYIEIQKADESRHFDVLQRKVNTVANRPNPNEPWLILFIDGVTSCDYLKEPRAQRLNQDGITLVVAISTTESTESILAEQITIENFTQKELLLLLQRQLGQAFHLLSRDVMDLIRRPILARLYLEIARGEAEWLPTNEYELVEKHWRSFAAGGWTAALQALELLAAQNLKDSSCPWTPKRLLDAGISERAYQHFLASGLLVASADGRTVRIWHDRVLEWAMAEGLTQEWLQLKPASETSQASEWLNAGVLAAIKPEPGRPRHNYVAYDVLWIILQEEASFRLHTAAKLIELIAPHGSLDLLQGSIETIGERLVPALAFWVKDLPDRDTSSGILSSDIGKLAATIKCKSAKKVALEAIQSDSPVQQAFGIKILARQAVREASPILRRLLAATRSSRGQLAADAKAEFNLWHLEAEMLDGVSLSDATVDSAALLLIEAGAQTNNVDLIQIEVLPRLPQGRQVWNQNRAVLLEKASESAPGIRLAAFCIYCFQDRSQVAREWLRQNVDLDAAFAGSMARLALWTCFRENGKLPQSEANLYEWALVCWWPARVYLDDSTVYESFCINALEHFDHIKTLALLPGKLRAISSSQVKSFAKAATEQLASLTATLEKGEAHPNSYILFDDFQDNINSNTLYFLWERCSYLEAALARYLVALGPNEDSWRSNADKGLDLLRMLAGPGIDLVIERFIKESKNYYCLLRAFELLERSCTSTNAYLLQMAQDSPEVGELNSYFTARCSELLASHGFWELAANNIIRLGLNNLRGLEYLALAAGPWSDAAVSYVIAALAEGTSPGALLALGLAQRPALVDYAHAALQQAGIDSESLKAAWLALDLLRDSSSKTKELAQQALALPAVVKDFRGLHSIACRMELTLTNAIPESKGELLESLQLPTAAQATVSDYLDFLVWIGEPHALTTTSHQEFLNFLWDRAYSNTGSPFANSRISAIRILAILEPENAFQVCKDTLRSSNRDDERWLLPRLALTLDFDRALVELRKILIEEADLRLVVAVGEGLVGHGEGGTGTILSWLQDNDELLREGAAIAARAFPWCMELENQLRSALDDRHWPVRDYAEDSLRQILNHKEIQALRRLLESQTTLPRKWAAMDAAIALGHPNISGVEPFWRSALIEGMPYLARKAADQKIKDLSKKLAKKLKDRKREQTWLILRKNQA